MHDEEILHRIRTVVDEERGGTLDHRWDLLRQRRALRAVGEDACAATVRDVDTIADHQQ